MKISDLMIPDPITITANASITDALELMKLNSIRHLPVVSGGNVLRGFVTLADLKQGLIPSMVGDVSLSDLMISNPIVVGPEEDIEIAAQLLYKHKIGGIPVVEGEMLVRIITQSDIVRKFICRCCAVRKSISNGRPSIMSLARNTLSIDGRPAPSCECNCSSPV